MPNGRKKTFATFASSMLVAASALVAALAPAQTGGGGSYDPNCCGITCGQVGGGYGYGCCEYDPYWENWYINHSWGREICTPYWRTPEESDDRPSLEAPEPAGR